MAHAARGGRDSEEDGGHRDTAGVVDWSGCTASSVEARISARRTVRGAERGGEPPPPMCIRQDAAPAVHTSACVESTLAILSVSMAVEVSAFFTAKVPP